MKPKTLDGIVKAPDHTTARAFNRYLSGEVLADSAALGWTGLYVPLFRLPRVVDRLRVPATPEPLVTCNAKGSGRVPRAQPRRRLDYEKNRARTDVRHPISSLLGRIRT